MPVLVTHQTQPTAADVIPMTCKIDHQQDNEFKRENQRTRIMPVPTGVSWTYIRV